MKSAILINDTSLESHVGSKAVINNIFQLCSQNEVKIISTFTRNEIIKWISRLDTKITECDMIIINGEGTFHDSPTFFDIFLARFDKYKDKKIVLINSLWQNMKPNAFTNYINKFHLISFRESLSTEAFKKQFPDYQNVSTVPDVVFATPAPDTIGFGDSVIEDIRDKLKEQPNYFPMNYLKNYPDVHAYLNWLKSLKLYVTGRFHGVCMSALVGTPFVAFKSNSHKIEGILKDMNCSELLISEINQVDPNKLIEIDLAQDKIKEYVSQAKIKIEQLFHRIGQL